MTLYWIKVDLNILVFVDKFYWFLKNHNFLLYSLDKWINEVLLVKLSNKYFFDQYGAQT